MKNQYLWFLLTLNLQANNFYQKKSKVRVVILELRANIFLVSAHTHFTISYSDIPLIFGLAGAFSTQMSDL